VTNPTSPARSRDPRRAKLCRAVAREVPLLDRAPLLRFSSPSAFAGSRCAVRAARLRTIPLRRSSPPLDPRPRTVRAMASPLRFSALRMRCGEARYADNPLAVSHTRSRRVNAAAQCAGNRLSDDRRCEDRPVKPDSIALRNDPSHQAPPLRSFAARNRSCAVGHALTAAFRYRFEPSRPGRSEWSFPLLGSATLMGFIVALRRFAPANGWRLISDPPGPLACSSRRPPRLILVGVIGPLDQIHSISA
jgi:hypothetical protein